MKIDHRNGCVLMFIAIAGVVCGCDLCNDQWEDA